MKESRLTATVINELLGVDDSYKAPEKLMELLMNKERREELFREFVKYETNVSSDWFRQYFEEEHAERKKKKQDFTPTCVSRLLTRLIGTDTTFYFEVAAGTGGILVEKWQSDRLAELPWTYRPSHYFYQVEELSDRTVPFLLFNMLIRGMNGIVVHGDSLGRTVKNIYFIQNENDDSLGFSSLNVMPRTKAVEEEFAVREWIGEDVVYIESKGRDEHW